MINRLKTNFKESKWNIVLFSLLIPFIIFGVCNLFMPQTMLQFTAYRNVGDFIMMLFRYITYTSFVIFPVAIIFNRRNYVNLILWIMLPCFVLYGCFIYSFVNLFRFTSFEIVISILYVIFGLAISICFYLKEKKFPLTNPIKGGELKTLGLILLGLFPFTFFMKFSPLMNAEFLKYHTFGIWHFFGLALAIIAPIILFFVLRKKDVETRHIIMVSLSLVLFYQLFTRMSVSVIFGYQGNVNFIMALPLYVCSFGIFLLPFAVLSENRFFQSMIAIINIAGSFAVFVYLDTGSAVSILHYDYLYFVFNHAILFGITLMLPLFEKAKMTYKNFLHVCWIFAIFIVSVTLINCGVIATQGFDPNFAYTHACPLPIGDIANIAPISLFGVKISLVYIFILYLSYLLIFFIGLLVWKLGIYINNRIKENKKIKAESKV